MILMPVSGYVTSSSEGRTVPWFGLFTWPDLLSENRPLGRAVGLVHHYGAYTFFALLFLHVGAAAWHKFVVHDEVLSRMLWMSLSDADEPAIVGDWNLIALPICEA
jgi:cytochrome b561